MEQYSRPVLGIHETVMLIMLLVVGIGYLVDRLASDAPDRGGHERERKQRGESS